MFILRIPFKRASPPNPVIVERKFIKNSQNFDLSKADKENETEKKQRTNGMLKQSNMDRCIPFEKEKERGNGQFYCLSIHNF